ncbi:hypothetical protein NA57DRAFT_46617 [Rhizodiscina lignyota]|uniref:Metallothionein-I gene transcription activator n=1 Tax=Rhizodiscina lignyota TaxID=1504668 RepID=A0A9P4M659_9PEZI|nr:hypothetical protein NA57DRAFT_46617 [Rhizodiscina lignyota]
MSTQQGGSGSPSYGGATGTANNPFNLTAQVNTTEDQSKPVQYACGECDNKVILKRGDPIRCKECGHRVLYKERTNRSVRQHTEDFLVDTV